jgi:hypothetical protein
MFKKFVFVKYGPFNEQRHRKQELAKLNSSALLYAVLFNASQS